MSEGEERSEESDEALEPGDRVLAFTDGVVEARTPDDGSLFGIDRLGNALEREFAGHQPAPESMRRLMRHVVEHQRYELRDDAGLSGGSGAARPRGRRPTPRR